MATSQRAGRGLIMIFIKKDKGEFGMVSPELIPELMVIKKDKGEFGMVSPELMRYGVPGINEKLYIKFQQDTAGFLTISFQGVVSREWNVAR